jgi:hypothetical protein
MAVVIGEPWLPKNHEKFVNMMLTEKEAKELNY